MCDVMHLEWFVQILVSRPLREASDVALRSLLVGKTTKLRIGVTYFLPHTYFYISFVPDFLGMFLRLYVTT